MNQYVKAKEQGLKPGDEGWPKQTETRVPMHQRTKEKISHTKRVQIGFEKAMETLENVMEKGKSESAQVQAAKAILERCVPNLSSVDSTNRDVTEKMSEEALVARLRVLIESNPELTSKILADNARGKTIKEVKESEAA